MSRLTLLASLSLAFLVALVLQPEASSQSHPAPEGNR